MRRWVSSTMAKMTLTRYILTSIWLFTWLVSSDDPISVNGQTESLLTAYSSTVTIDGGLWIAVAAVGATGTPGIPVTTIEATFQPNPTITYSSSSVVYVFLNSYLDTYVGSVVTANPSLTIYNIEVQDPFVGMANDATETDCCIGLPGFAGNLTVTNNNTYIYTASDIAPAVISEECIVYNPKSVVCSSTLGGFYTIARGVLTVSPEQLTMMPLTITAGFEKLQTPTATPAATVGSGSSGSASPSQTVSAKTSNAGRIQIWILGNLISLVALLGIL